MLLEICSIFSHFLAITQSLGVRPEVNKPPSLEPLQKNRVNYVHWLLQKMDGFGCCEPKQLWVKT
jgi:hypothetical protein